MSDIQAKVDKMLPGRINLLQCAPCHAPRAVLVGNAAQTLHPLGAQGFNLGVRDVATLVEFMKSFAKSKG